MVKNPSSSTLTAKQQAERQHLALHLHKLITVQHVKPQDIMIISCQSQMRSAIFRTTAEPLSHTVTATDGTTQTFVYLLNKLKQGIIPGKSPVATIRTAKGLESDVVILVELDGLRSGQFAHMSSEHIRAVIFVGVSRARSHIIIFGRERDIFIADTP